MKRINFIPVNKKRFNRDQERSIRRMFFQKKEMRNICRTFGVSESVIRRIAREKKWSAKRDRYYKWLCYEAYRRGITLNCIAKKTGVMAYTLYELSRVNKLPHAKRIAWNNRNTEEMEDKFIEDYSNGLSAQKIANKYGFKTRKTVLDVLRNRKICRRPPKIQTYYNESFFKKIDSPEKAYVLGLIMTDGYIVKDYCGFGIQLTKEDGYILEKIAIIIGARQGVKEIVCNTKREKMPNVKDMVRLTIHNRKIAENLKEKGVVRNKSKVIRYRGGVPRKYMSHFFRGLIDGDGTVGTAKNKNIWCQISSASVGFIKDLLKIGLPFKFTINYSNTTMKDGRKFKSYVLRLGGGNTKTIQFLKWLYGDKGDLYLRRKYEKVQRYLC